MESPTDDLQKTAERLLAELHDLSVSGALPTNPAFNTNLGLRAMRKFACVLLLVLSLAPALPAAAPAQTVDATAVDPIVQEALKAWQVPGAAVAIVRGDEVIYVKGHGVRELGKPDPVTPETLFAIGSTTKAFTATAVGMLVDDGKMAWDDLVRKHVEFFHLADPPPMRT
jgi:CubicO group peptidase (beta-lactamase class C family)